MASSNDPGRAEQRWLADRYAENARFVADLGAPLLDMLAPQPGERILDLGCGDGALTERIADAGARVVGVDASADQIAASCARGLDAHVVDGHSLGFEAEFDAILTNAALHWMTRPDLVAAGMHRALVPGGRVVGEMGGRGNVAIITGELLRALARRGIDGEAAFPWYFPGPDEYAAKLESAGFRVDSIALIERPTPLPGDITGWLATFAEAFVLAVPRPMRQEFIDEVREELRPRLVDDAGVWVADYIRLRFLAVKSAG
jgi:SAM-dependent methyltransferase